MGDTNADGVLQARRFAMDALARREHSVQELERKLESKDLDPRDVRIALTELQADGLLSDERFAEALVSSWSRRGKGPLRIRHDLKNKGVSEVLIDQALESSHTDWYALAREVMAKKFGASSAQDIKERAKRSRFLHYRGFDGEQIRHALEN
ncbi:MAG: regulatory protein RecX [Pseudomonadota bacterium]